MMNSLKLTAFKWIPKKTQWGDKPDPYPFISKYDNDPSVVQGKVKRAYFVMIYENNINEAKEKVASLESELENMNYIIFEDSELRQRFDEDSYEQDITDGYIDRDDHDKIAEYFDSVLSIIIAGTPRNLDRFQKEMLERMDIEFYGRDHNDYKEEPYTYNETIYNMNHHIYR